MSDPLTIKTGADFKAWRLDAGYSIRELAAGLGVSRSTIERWQAGQPVPPRLALWALRGLSSKREAFARAHVKGGEHEAAVAGMAPDLRPKPW